MNRRQFAGVAGALVGLSTLAGNAAAEAAKKKILFVLSNGAAMGDGRARSNLWEVAEPHHVFVMHGYRVDFVSPQGGRVPFSLDEDESDLPGMVSYTIKYEGFRQKANATMTPDAVVANEYAAVFVGGGAGPLFDVAKDPRLLSIIARIYENGGVVGGGGHGPGSFSNVKLSSGEHLVKGKRVTGFPNSSEKNSKWSKGGSLLPFLVEDGLRAGGAIFLTKTDLRHKHDVVIDQRLVTTMFLPSSAIVAQEMVNLLSP
jgi:putative intracellular protease/amidase